MTTKNYKLGDREALECIYHFDEEGKKHLIYSLLDEMSLIVLRDFRDYLNSRIEEHEYLRGLDAGREK